MTATILAAALGALAGIPQETDTLISVPRDVRIEVSNLAGDVTVSAWEQNQVRVLAEHGSDDILEIEVEGNELSIKSVSPRGYAIIDLELTVPAGASLEISAPFADVRITGTEGSVAVESGEGDIHLEGGGGRVQVAAVDGDITILNTRADVMAAAVDGSVTITDVAGAIEAESVDGDVILRNADSDNVEAATVDGDILWDGDIQDGGRYSFVTHDGDVTVGVQPGANAKVFVASFDADFVFDFEVTIPPGEQESKRFSFILGTGSARLELESFDGTIHLTRPGSR